MCEGGRKGRKQGKGREAGKSGTKAVKGRKKGIEEHKRGNKERSKREKREEGKTCSVNEEMPGISGSTLQNREH